MNNDEINLYIPHRLPALLVERVGIRESDSIEVFGRVPPEHPAVAGDRVPAVLAMEFAAQGAGLLLGFLHKEEAPERMPPKKGYLASLLGVQLVDSTLPVDQEMRAEVSLEVRLGMMALFSATVAMDGGKVATGRFAIAGE